MQAYRDAGYKSRSTMDNIIVFVCIHFITYDLHKKNPLHEVGMKDERSKPRSGSIMHFLMWCLFELYEKCVDTTFK